MLDDFDTDRWYWDRRTRKALYPRRTDEDTIWFVSIWHREEVADALDRGALVPLVNVGLDRTDTAFDLIDSFRTVDVGASGSDDMAVSEERDD